MASKAYFSIVFEGIDANGHHFYSDVVQVNDLLEDDVFELPCEFQVSSEPRIAKDAQPILSAYGNMSGQVSFTVIHLYKTPYLAQDAMFSCVSMWRNVRGGFLTIKTRNGVSSARYGAVLQSISPRISLTDKKLYISYSFLISPSV